MTDPSDSSRKETEEIVRRAYSKPLIEGETPPIIMEISASLHARELEIGRLKAYFCESHLPTPANEYKRCGWCAYREMAEDYSTLEAESKYRKTMMDTLRAEVERLDSILSTQPIDLANVEMKLQEQSALVELLTEALRAYTLKYPCPGFEVAVGAGETSGCDPTVGTNDCPTCEVVNSAPSVEVLLERRRLERVDERRKGYAEALLDAAELLCGDVLKDGNEFSPKEKLKVFDLLERIRMGILGLISNLDAQGKEKAP